VATEWMPTPRTRKLPVGGNDGRTRTRISWGCGGMVLGALVMVLFLVVFDPSPKVVQLSPPAPSHIMVTVDDQYLTRVVIQGIIMANLPGFTIANVKAHIAPNNVIMISGTMQAIATPLADLNAQGQVTASGGLLVVSNIFGTFGGLTLPSVVDSSLEFGINLAIANERQRLTQGGIHYYIEGVSSTDGRLTLMLTFS
jgi:hypothetical protein